MDEDNNPFTGPLLPLTLVALTAIFFLMSQLGSINQGTQSMSWQNERADKLIKKLQESSATLDKSVEENKPLVAQSEQSQRQFTEMMKELDELAHGGDKDADLIIKQYGIKVNEAADASKKDPAKKDSEKKDDKPAEKKSE